MKDVFLQKPNVAMCLGDDNTLVVAEPPNVGALLVDVATLSAIIFSKFHLECANDVQKAATDDR